MTDLSTIDEATVTVIEKRSLWYRLYHGLTRYDFIGRMRIGLFISATLLVITLASLFTRGLNLGLDFKGGVVLEPPAKNGLNVDKAASILSANGIDAEDSKIQIVTGASGERVRVQTGTEPIEVQTKLRQEFATAAGVDVDEVPLSSVSSTWGSEITRSAIRALLFFFAGLTVFIWWRFKGWRMALAAFVAVVHDVLISVGVYSVFGLVVTPATVIAFLTILGFSLYDTIVVFDKVNENAKKMVNGVSYSDVVNVSMNETLMRSLNTSLAAVLPVLSLLVIGSGLLGAVALREFALALFVGLLTGAYSSIFIASPLLAMLHRYGKKGRDTLLHSSGKMPKRFDVALAANIMSGQVEGVRAAKRALLDGDAPRAAAGVTTMPVSPSAGLTHPPRPRKKKRR